MKQRRRSELLKKRIHKEMTVSKNFGFREVIKILRKEQDRLNSAYGETLGRSIWITIGCGKYCSDVSCPYNDISVYAIDLRKCVCYRGHKIARNASSSQEKKEVKE